MQKDYEKLRQLEESLWIAKTRFDGNYMNKILSPHFFEFGRSGGTYTREECMGMPIQEIHAKLRDFVFQPINADVVLVRYVSEVTNDEIIEISNRSSIWSKTAVGWKLEFHQGTPVV